MNPEDEEHLDSLFGCVWVDRAGVEVKEIVVSSKGLESVIKNPTEVILGWASGIERTLPFGGECGGWHPEWTMRNKQEFLRWLKVKGW